MWGSYSHQKQVNMIAFKLVGVVMSPLTSFLYYLLLFIQSRISVYGHIIKIAHLLLIKTYYII